MTTPAPINFETKLYQNLTLNGRDLPAVDPKRQHSHFWNEGKWRYFIKPLLPQNPADMTLVEMGANAGLFLKLAKDYGFRNALGVEKDPRTCQAGLKYRDALNYDYRLVNRTVGPDFDIDDLPLADVTLLANFHYYLTVGDFLEYLDRLRTKTIYCLVVTSDHHSPSHHWRASSLIPDIRNYFRDWEEVGAVNRVSYTSRLTSDPAPRRLQSILFKSRLKRVPLADVKWGAPGSAKEKDIHRQELAQLLIKHGPDFPITKTAYYRAWKNRYDWSDRKTADFVRERVNFMEDIRQNGMKKPIWLSLDHTLINGGHRIALLQALGYSSIIARII